MASSTDIKALDDLQLQTERLRIRPLHEADLRHIYPIHSDALVNKHLPYDTWLNWDDAKHWFAKTMARQKNNDARQFVIETGNDTSLIGTCIVFNVDAQAAAAEFGYVLARSAWGKGYMFEAMSAFMAELHARLCLAVLNASVESDNHASLSLLKRLHFEHIDTTIEESGVHLCRLQKQFETHE